MTENPKFDIVVAPREIVMNRDQCRFLEVYLRDRKLIDGADIFYSVSISRMTGKHVLGGLPINIAFCCKSVTPFNEYRLKDNMTRIVALGHARGYPILDKIFGVLKTFSVWEGVGPITEVCLLESDVYKHNFIMNAGDIIGNAPDHKISISVHAYIQNIACTENPAYARQFPNQQTAYNFCRDLNLVGFTVKPLSHC